jgi:hypothetical protein
LLLMLDSTVRARMQPMVHTSSTQISPEHHGWDIWGAMTLAYGNSQQP